MTTLSLGFIGDSITAGVNGTPVTQCVARLQALGYTVSSTNRGISGTTTQDWLPTGSNLAAAIQAFQSAAVNLVHLMLGTNDTKASNAFTPLQHFSNMQLIVNALLAGGFPVMISKPLFTVGGSFNGQWSDNPSALYPQYWNADLQLVDGVFVFIGDSANYAASAVNTVLLADGVHPTSQFNIAAGDNWAVAIDQKSGITRGFRGGFLLTNPGYRQAPGAPTLTTASASTTSVAVSLASSSAGGQPQTYTVQRSTAAAFTAGVTTISSNLPYSIGSVTVTDGGLSSGSTYYYRATASNPVGDSAYSAIVSGAPISAATSYATALSAASGATGSPVLITYTPNGPWTSGQALTPTLTSLAGSFASSSNGAFASGVLTPSAGSSAAATITFTPSSAATGSISSTSNPALTNTTGALTFTATSAARSLPSITAASPSIWLDASNAATLFSDAGSTKQSANGGLVQAMVDALSSGRQVIQTTSGRQPTLATGKANGRNMLAFNGSTCTMASATGQTWVNSMRSGSPFTVRTVFITTNNNVGQGVIAALPGNANTYGPGVDIYIDTAGSIVNTALLPIDTIPTKAAIALPVAGSVVHCVMRYDGTTLSCRSSAGGTDAIASNSTSGTSLDQLVVGYLPNLNWYLNGWFGEFAMWPGAATSAEVDVLLNEAASWWGS